MSETNIPASEAPNAASGAEIMARARRDQESIARHLTNPRRVVVTGMGAVSPAGFGVDRGSARPNPRDGENPQKNAEPPPVDRTEGGRCQSRARAYCCQPVIGRTFSWPT